MLLIITNFAGSSSQTINYAILKSGNLNGGAPVEISSVSNINISSIANKKQSLSLNKAGIDKVKELLKKSPYSFRLYLDGSVNEIPLNFTIKFIFEVIVTYELKVP